MKSLEELRAALQHPNVQAWLRCIRYGESHDSDARAYMALYGWSVFGEDAGHVFTDFSDHPQVYTTLGDGRKTSAAGAYQIVYTTWKSLRQRRPDAYPDFSPSSQDLAAVDLTDGRGALEDVIAGRLLSAILKCRDEWTSLPGAMESKRTVEQYRRVFTSWGGTLADDPQPGVAPEQPPAPVEDRSTQHMPDEPNPLAGIAAAAGPIIGAINPIAGLVFSALTTLLPALAPLAKSEKAKQNVAIATGVLEAVKTATGAANEQQALEMVKADPAVLLKADTAVRDAFGPMLQVMETGGGPPAARAYATAAVAGADHWWKLVLNPVLLVTVLTLPLVYLIVIELTKHMGKVSGDVIAQSIGAVIGAVLGGVMGFWTGTTYSQANANRRTDLPTQPTQ